MLNLEVNIMRHGTQIVLKIKPCICRKIATRRLDSRAYLDLLAA